MSFGGGGGSRGAGQEGQKELICRSIHLQMVDEPIELDADVAEQLVSIDYGTHPVHAGQLRTEQRAFFYTFRQPGNEYKRLLSATVLGMAQSGEAVPGRSADTG